MRLTCPACGAMNSLEALLTDVQAREAVAAALAFPAPLGDRLLRYLGLFRPDSRALSWERVARLLRELLAPIQAGRITRDGRQWAAPMDLWVQALDQVLEDRVAGKLNLPLKSHGYLFAVVSGLAGKGEARSEAQREQERAYPVQNGRTCKTEAVADTATALEWLDKGRQGAGLRRGGVK